MRGLCGANWLLIAWKQSVKHLSAFGGTDLLSRFFAERTPLRPATELSILARGLGFLGTCDFSKLRHLGGNDGGVVLGLLRCIHATMLAWSNGVVNVEDAKYASDGNTSVSKYR